jgi:hypothetical protein
MEDEEEEKQDKEKGMCEESRRRAEKRKEEKVRGRGASGLLFWAGNLLAGHWTGLPRHATQIIASVKDAEGHVLAQLSMR